jgi:hypothetical protein
MAGGVFLRLVAPGEAAEVIAALGRAVELAERVRVLLVLAEFDVGSVQVVPSLTEAGEPVVYLTGLTDSARRCLVQVLPGSAGLPSGTQPPDDRVIA